MRRSTPNTILINVCQVSFSAIARKEAIDATNRVRAQFKLTFEFSGRAEGQSSDHQHSFRGVGVRRHQGGLPGRRHFRCSLPLVRPVLLPFLLHFADARNVSRLRYHLLHPEYIHGRIKNLGQSYGLRLMIVHCDVDNHQAAMRELTKVCIINEYTMIVAWT